MADINRITFYKDWIEPYIKDLTEDEINVICGAIVRHVWYEPQDPESYETSGVRMALRVVLPKVDKVIGKTEEAIDQGKFGGRPKAADNQGVWLYCRDHPEASAGTVAKHFGIKSPNTIYSNKGWKNRHNPTWED